MEGPMSYDHLKQLCQLFTCHPVRDLLQQMSLLFIHSVFAPLVTHLISSSKPRHIYIKRTEHTIQVHTRPRNRCNYYPFFNTRILNSDRESQTIL